MRLYKPCFVVIIKAREGGCLTAPPLTTNPINYRIMKLIVKLIYRIELAYYLTTGRKPKALAIAWRKEGERVQRWLNEQHGTTYKYRGAY